MRMPAVLAALGVLWTLGAAPAHAAAYKCPTGPADYANGQSLAGGWQVWIEGAERARVERWSNGVVFLHPALGSQTASAELQCLGTGLSDGRQVAVEARMPLETRRRCAFSRAAQAFDCGP